MRPALADIAESLAAIVGDIDPDVLLGGEAIELGETFGRIERLASAGRTMAVGAIDRTKAYLREGHRSAASLMASTQGMTVGAAQQMVDTSRRLEGLQATRDALVAGHLSPHQAVSVAMAAAADPSAERRLLCAAPNLAVSVLRRDARMVVAAAAGGEDRLKGIRETRYLHLYDDPDGACRLDARLAPDDGARLRATLEHRADRAIREGSRDAGYLPREQALADALMSLLDGPGVGPRPTLHVHVDAAALARGRLAPGERCEVAGVGPVTVDMATGLAAAGRTVPDTPDGAESVRTRDRFIPSKLRAAVDARFPKCAITACPNSRSLDYDHRVPLSQGGTTSLDNLWRLCRRRCHMLKTHHGWVPARQGDSWVLMPPARGP